MATRKINRQRSNATALPEAIVSELLLALSPQKLPKKREVQMRKRLMEKISAEVQPRFQNKPVSMPATNAHSPQNRTAAEGFSGITTIRISDAAASSWHPKAPGIDAKILFDDGRTMTSLVRFAAGARLAAHRHHGVEETTVLQGYCYLGEVNFPDESINVRLNPGDYQLAEDGSTHPEVYSPEGCVLLIRSASLKASRTRVASGLRT